MNGIRLEADTLIIYGSEPSIRNLTKCVFQAGIDIDDLVVSPIASSKAVLTDRQKELGVVLVDIGGGTTSLAVFEEKNLLFTSILPIGAAHITNDIAIGLRCPIDVAEKVKLEYGFSLPSEISDKETIDLSKIDKNEEGEVSRHHLAEIIEARLSEIFSLVNKELKKIKKDKLLPSGVVLTGGGSKLPGIVDMTKEYLSLPVQIGFPKELGGVTEKVDDPAYTVALGLVFGGIEIKSGKTINLPQGPVFDKVRKWFKSFLP